MGVAATLPELSEWTLNKCYPSKFMSFIKRETKGSISGASISK